MFERHAVGCRFVTVIVRRIDCVYPQKQVELETGMRTLVLL